MFLPIHNGGMTKAIQIFRSGTHIDSHGQKITISNDDIDKMISEYNEGNHKAPLTIGHPKDNHPAFGWIEKLKRKGNLLYASFCDVHDDVKQAVSDKLYQKVSASFYAPQHPHNYSEGWGIRHVGLLGATAPAVKGLEDVAFSDDGECHIFEFAEVRKYALNGFARSMREFVIAQFNIEIADKFFPNYSVEDIAYDPEETTPLSNFSENPAIKLSTEKDKPMTDKISDEA